ncbi:MAG TPA: Hpt domain-containing protein, partial [Caulobacteraceae bacterium]
TDPMAAFRARFLDRCRGELAILADPSHPDFRRVVHGLAGGAGVFGYPVISERADVVDQALAEGRPADPAALAALVEEIEAALRSA